MDLHKERLKKLDVRYKQLQLRERATRLPWTLTKVRMPMRANRHVGRRPFSPVAICLFQGCHSHCSVCAVSGLSIRVQRTLPEKDGPARRLMIGDGLGSVSKSGDSLTSFSTLASCFRQLCTRVNSILGAAQWTRFVFPPGKTRVRLSLPLKAAPLK